LTVDAVNDFGNVTRYFYDGLSRQTRQEVILTEKPVEIRGTSTGGNTATTLNDATGPFRDDHARFGQLVVITAGTGAGQTRRIASSTATQLVVSAPWDVTPDATSQYRVLSGTASGDGVHIGATLEGRKDVDGVEESFPPAPDPTQGGGDGI